MRLLFLLEGIASCRRDLSGEVIRDLADRHLSVPIEIRFATKASQEVIGEQTMAQRIGFQAFSETRGADQV